MPSWSPVAPTPEVWTRVGTTAETWGTIPPTPETWTRVGPAPVNIVAPQITGLAEVGATLTLSAGSWSNSPTSYARTWYRDGAIILGETGATYTVQAGDAGLQISARVVATNAWGIQAAYADGVTIATSSPVDGLLVTIGGALITLKALPVYLLGAA